MKLLKIENLSKIKDNSMMLDRISFDSRIGQICGIISDNQDKLNLLINIIGGNEKESSGGIYYKNRTLSLNARIKAVGIVRGSGHLIERLNVLDNIFIGSFHKYSKLGLISYKKIKARAKDILDTLHLKIDLKSSIRDLNHHEKLLLEIARALAMDPDYYIFCNITRSLSLRQFESFTNIIRNLKSSGKCVILLPGTAEDVKLFIDRLFFLNNSKLNEIADYKGMSDEKLNEMLLSSEKLHTLHVYDPIYKAKMIMNEKIDHGELDFHMIADNVYLGYDTFRRKFKNEVGLSPNQYFLKIKIEKAKELLLYSHYEIKEIAEKLGYSDPYYFSRIFKEKENIPPTKFRDGRSDFFK